MLFKLVSDAEYKSCDGISWSVKVLKQPGTPLAMKFISKFPIIQGCPRGEVCTVCDNDGIIYSPCGVIYQGKCKLCGDTELPQIYVGKTSRPVRERIIEHRKNAHNIDPDSVLVQHWAECTVQKRYVQSCYHFVNPIQHGGGNLLEVTTFIVEFHQN